MTRPMLLPELPKNAKKSKQYLRFDEIGKVRIVFEDGYRMLEDDLNNLEDGPKITLYKSYIFITVIFPCSTLDDNPVPVL